MTSHPSNTKPWPSRLQTILAMVLMMGFFSLLQSCKTTESSDTIDQSSRKGHGDDVWGANYFPNISLTTQDGKQVHFYDDLIKDKVVAVNFIYTTCPDACPMETARLLEVYRILKDRMGKDIFFYSITIDPEKDTPEVLKSYIERWGIGEGWTFLTGKKEDILLLRQKLGVLNAESSDGSKENHNLSLTIGNQKTGRWMKRSPFENPYVLANQLGSWLTNWKMPSNGGSYDEAPKLRQLSDGENLFRTRCAACHTVGQGETSVPEERRVGPDLYHISRLRERAWLERWIMEPDKMLAEADPTATALLAQYQNVQMPNLRMTPIDVANVMDYIDSESKRIDESLEQQHANPTVSNKPPGSDLNTQKNK